MNKGDASGKPLKIQNQIAPDQEGVKHQQDPQETPIFFAFENRVAEKNEGHGKGHVNGVGQQGMEETHQNRVQLENRPGYGNQGRSPQKGFQGWGTRHSSTPLGLFNPRIYRTRLDEFQKSTSFPRKRESRLRPCESREPEKEKLDSPLSSTGHAYSSPERRPGQDLGRHV